MVPVVTSGDPEQQQGSVGGLPGDLGKAVGINLQCQGSIRSSDTGSECSGRGLTVVAEQVRVVSA